MGGKYSRWTVALNIVATWSTEEGRLESIHSLHEINTVSVLAVLVSWREQAQKVEVNRSFRACGIPGEMKSVVGIRSIVRRLEGVVELSPCTGLGGDVDRRLRVGGAGEVGLQRNIDAAIEVALDVEGSLVLPCCYSWEAPVTVIVHSHAAAIAAGHLQGAGECGGEWGGEVLQGEAGAADWMPVDGRLGVDVVALKRTVLDKLSVDTSITAVVDVLVVSAEDLLIRPDILTSNIKP